MSKLLKSLLAATAVLALAPATASARPKDCFLVCDYEAFCEDICWNGALTTCGDYGFCGASLTESSDETASVAHDEAQQSDASSLVCGEEQQAAEPSVSVES